MNLMRNAAFTRQMKVLVLAELLVAAVMCAGMYAALRGGAFQEGLALLAPAAMQSAAASQALAVGLAAGAALGAVAAGATACGLFARFSQQRYREIARLASEVDEVLHGTTGRPIDFSDYREGDVAILKNELAKMVATLRDANERLAAERTALADALADISHQIRTPLTAMGLMVPLVENASNERERTRTLCELETLIDRVGWLVTALLKLAKVDAGAFHVKTQPVSAERVVRRALEPLAASMDLHGVECVVRVEKGSGAQEPGAEGQGAEPSFTGDAAWTAEAVENVLKNCMEHTPAGGFVRVRVWGDALACRIRITDSGSGISAEDMPHVFERFYRGRTAGSADDTSPSAVGTAVDAASDAPAQVQQGFGIGLALAKSLVEAQGGTLQVRNALTGGAQFDLAFPKMTV